MGISVVLLAKKEAKNLEMLLPEIIEQVKNTKEQFEIIVIDAQTPEDNSKEVCEKYNARYINQEYPYFGGAYKTGIKYAKYDKYLCLDCDGSHPPSKITEVYETFIKNNCDVVIGSRYVNGGKTDDSLVSIMMSKLLNKTFKICLGINVNDFSSGFRLYKTELLKNINIEYRYFDVMEEILLKMYLNKPDIKIEEIPIHFQKRYKGESKRNMPIFITSFVKSLIQLTWMRILFNIQKRGMKC